VNKEEKERVEWSTFEKGWRQEEWWKWKWDSHKTSEDRRAKMQALRNGRWKERMVMKRQI